MAGQSVGLIDEIKSVDNIIKELVEDCNKAFTEVSDLLI